MTLLGSLERRSPSVPGVSNPVEDMGSCPVLSAKGFFFCSCVCVCVVDFELASLPHMLRGHIATCIATWGRPIA